MSQKTLSLSLYVFALCFVTAISASSGGPPSEPCQICLHLSPYRTDSDNRYCVMPEHLEEVTGTAPFFDAYGTSFTSFNGVDSPWCVCEFTAYSKPLYSGKSTQFTLSETCYEAALPFCAKSFTVTCQRGIPPPPVPEGGCFGTNQESEIIGSE